MNKILFIEDEDEYRAFITPILQENGWEVHTAVNGADGLRLFRTAKMETQPFDLIITDSVMPMMTGIELTARIRMENKELPIFVLSGYEDSREKALKAGCSRFMLKPIRRSELVEFVHMDLQTSKEEE